MKITLLGTSHGAPERDRFCSANYIEIENRGYLIDAGAPVEALLMRNGKSIEELRAIFLTHMHSDHVDGLFALAKSLIVYHPQAKADIYIPEESAIEGFWNWLSIMHIPSQKERILLHAIHPGLIYEDEVVRVTAITNDHMGVFPSFSFLLETQGKRVIFTGDLSRDFHDYPRYALENDCDLVICEFAHFDAEKALPMLQSTRTKQMIFYHIYDVEGRRKKAIKDQLPYPHSFASDGDITSL